HVTGVQTCALPISHRGPTSRGPRAGLLRAADTRPARRRIARRGGPVRRGRARCRHGGTGSAQDVARRGAGCRAGSGRVLAQPAVRGRRPDRPRGRDHGHLPSQRAHPRRVQPRLVARAHATADPRRPPRRGRLDDSGNRGGPRTTGARARRCPPRRGSGSTERHTPWPGDRTAHGDRAVRRTGEDRGAALMRVLVTNHDGSDYPGLAVLASVAKEAGHEVTIAAPSHEYSGASASLTGHEIDGRLELTAGRPPGLADGITAFGVRAAPALIVFSA